VTRHASTVGGASAPPAVPGERIPRHSRLAAQDVILLTMTALAVAIRLYLLSRNGYLSGITEYDDGVYLGGTVSLLSGAVPYRDFAFVQPPGILLLMAPVALIAKATAISSAMAAARVATIAASCACVALTGVLVRHRGPLVTLVACGVLAVYPDDIMSAHTLLLEPWMNLLVLAGACLAFRAGQLAPPGRLLGAGLLFGLAGAVKYWAVIPALGIAAVCLATRWPATRARRNPAWFAGGTAAGFLLPVLPFAAAAPVTFFRSTVTDQASRAGSAVPEPLRLAHLTGLADLLNDAGRLTLSGNDGTLFARGDVTAAATWATAWLPLLAAALLAAALGLGYARARTRPGLDPLGAYALGTLAATVAAVLAYSAFFYHYADFTAPWLAIAAGYAAGGLLWRSGRRTMAAVAALVALAACGQAWELSGLHASPVAADAALIRPGACVVTDEIALAIAANRFTAGRGGCPDVLDALAVTLVAGNGTSVQGGAAAIGAVTAQWKSVLSRARYVWLSSSSCRRIPWTPALRAWFGRTFRALHPPPGQFSEGQVYIRRG
jgi:alpha-1,2-mannosyltransferase